MKTIISLFVLLCISIACGSKQDRFCECLVAAGEYEESKTAKNKARMDKICDEFNYIDEENNIFELIANCAKKYE